MIVRTISGITFAIFASLIASPSHADSRHAMNGIASVYGYDGRKTANGEIANSRGMTAAHRTLPFGTKVRVTHRKSGKSVVVRINDRGPFIRGRVIDLTPRAASLIGFSGLAPVQLTVVN